MTKHVVAVVFFLGFTLMSCAHPRHVAVVADASIYESIADLHATEQVALCGQRSCAGVAPQPVQGWSVEKSIAFNRKLLPLAEAGRQFDAELRAWRSGQPAPKSIGPLVNGIGESIAAVVADFPDGPSKAAMLQKIAVVQQLAIRIVADIITIAGG